MGIAYPSGAALSSPPALGCRGRVLGNEFSQITERKFVDVQLPSGADGRKGDLEGGEFSHHLATTRDLLIAALIAPPTRNLAEEDRAVVSVRMDVLPGNVRHEAAKAMSVPIEDKTALGFLRRSAE